MSYRAFLEAHPESVQDLELSARRRLDEAATLVIDGQHHSAIYLAGLAAEMLLKSACFLLARAGPADAVEPLLAPVRRKARQPHLRQDFESGHGLWFWSQELLERRRTSGASAWSRSLRRSFLQTCALLHADWFVSMRYRPGSAKENVAMVFLAHAEWIANNHGALRS
ncbi:MAG TPA: hypothetical protein VGG39_06140 [Polyangiaceae bacterium]|jgi:hypothetical protein